MKTLFLCSNPRVEASMRFRVLQFLAPFERAGHTATISTFFDERRSGWGNRVLRGAVRRTWDVARSRTADRLFVHREAFPLALNWYVKALPSAVPLIFDFDDAVFLRAGAGWRGRLAQPESTRLLVERAAVVFAGNEYLADYASKMSSRVRIVPTVVDTGRFCPAERPDRPVPLVGWVGSPSTSRYLDAIMPVLDEVGALSRFTLRIVGAGRDFKLQNVAVENVPWTLGQEVSGFQDLDIGLYPLADDAWARGKCGFKAIQYMACGVPFVVNPVGAITDIVREGTDGLWARYIGDWKDHLLLLLRSQSERKRLVANARQRAIEHYSTQALAPAWIQAVEDPARAGAGSGALQSGVAATDRT